MLYVRFRSYLFDLLRLTQIDWKQRSIVKCIERKIGKLIHIYEVIKYVFFNFKYQKLFLVHTHHGIQLMVSIFFSIP